MRTEPVSSLGICHHGSYSMLQNNVLVGIRPNQSPLELVCLGADSDLCKHQNTGATCFGGAGPATAANTALSIPGSRAECSEHRCNQHCLRHDATGINDYLQDLITLNALLCQSEVAREILIPVCQQKHQS